MKYTKEYLVKCYNDVFDDYIARLNQMRPFNASALYAVFEMQDDIGKVINGPGMPRDVRQALSGKIERLEALCKLAITTATNNLSELPFGDEWFELHK